ncbi:autophagy-related protein 17 [Holdemania massiliensis]|uniref:autophagy-related protein 17 n=1 Tax=Holdemania massiliensis TaxID=1468449 RepID=UPI001F05E88E|nr:autophagy-related protein 17 [Holdemania massiliensis]MCH1939078.1 hypothetical protein [Holdemania massiliensis]
MMERTQALLEQLAQDNQVTVDDVIEDLQRRIDEAWAATEDSLLHAFFKNQKPCPGMFIMAFDLLQEISDQVQEILEAMIQEESEAGIETSIEVADQLTSEQLKDPIETFLAMLKSLKSNAPIIRMIYRQQA